ICQLIVAHDKASMRNFAQELIDEIIDHTANMRMGATAGLCESPSAQTVAKVGALGLSANNGGRGADFTFFSHLILNPRTIQSFFDLGQLRRFGESCGLKTLWIQVPRLEESNIIQFLSSLQFHAARFGGPPVVSSFPSLEILWLSGAEIDVTGTIQHMQLDVPRLQQGHTPPTYNVFIWQDKVVPILDFMAAISSHKLNVLRIYQLILEDWTTMAENPWRDIDALLASERFLALRLFHAHATHIKLAGDLDPQQYHFDFTASSEVRDAMPLSTARGILHGPMTM
ncbi:hypothetical protein B0H14DRAFT_2780746, partial [Mycena olivaceomarginata]